MAQTTAEEYKDLGNAAFSSQDFDVAIANYTKAIQLDPQNHIYFSNRSASHAALKNWVKAAEDAKECVRLNPQFMKGYYRLATAQLELDQHDLAMATIKQGLSLDAKNTQLQKVMRNIKQAKREVSTISQATQIRTGGVSREIQDLQVQLTETARDYNTVKANLSKFQREQRMSQLTLDELERNPSRGSYFLSSGKVFVKQGQKTIVERLKGTMANQAKQEMELHKKIEYLEKKMHSQQQNINELRLSG